MTFCFLLKKGKRYLIILQKNKWQLNLPPSQFLTRHFTSKSSRLGNFNFSLLFQLLKCSWTERVDAFYTLAISRHSLKRAAKRTGYFLITQKNWIPLLVGKRLTLFLRCFRITHPRGWWHNMNISWLFVLR